METDEDGLIGAGRYERSGERTTWRNGHRDRALDTRLGSLQLRIPKLRQGSYFPPFLEARKVSEKALIAVIQEAWIGGVSTRRIDELGRIQVIVATRSFAGYHRKHAVRRCSFRRCWWPILAKHSVVLGLVQDEPARSAGAASGILDKTCARRSARGSCASIFVCSFSPRCSGALATPVRFMWLRSFFKAPSVTYITDW
jgi:Transposase, Mutator family